MSLDRRLRAELERDANAIVVEVERNLEAVEARARKRGSIGSPLVLSAAALILIVVALRFGGLPPNWFGANPTASVPAASPYPCPAGQGTCLGPLRPGTYSTRSFAPKIQYTVGDGWDNTQDKRAQLDLAYLAGGTYRYPDGTKFHDAISIFRRPVAESSTAFVPLDGIGRTALDLATWLDTRVDLVTSEVTTVTVAGVAGYRIEVALPAGPRTSPDHCTTDHDEPRCASIFLSADPGNSFGFGIVGPELTVIYLLDAPSGDTVMIVIDDADGVDQAGLIAAATPILNSLAFVQIAEPTSTGR